MARNQARPNRLIRADDGTFGTIWGYNMDLQPIEMALDPEFFNSCRGNFLAGDMIRVVEMKTFGKQKRVTASCNLVVMSKSEQKVDVELYEGKPIYRYDLPEEIIADEAKRSAEKDFGTKEEYIKGDGQVEKPMGGDYQIKTDQGVVGSAFTLGEAKAKARGDIPL